MSGRIRIRKVRGRWEVEVPGIGVREFRSFYWAIRYASDEIDAHSPPVTA